MRNYFGRRGQAVSLTAQICLSRIQAAQICLSRISSINSAGRRFQVHNDNLGIGPRGGVLPGKNHFFPGKTPLFSLAGSKQHRFALVGSKQHRFALVGFHQLIQLMKPEGDFRYTTIISKSGRRILSTQRYFPNPEAHFRYTAMFLKSGGAFQVHNDVFKIRRHILGTQRCFLNPEAHLRYTALKLKLKLKVELK